MTDLIPKIHNVIQDVHNIDREYQNPCQCKICRCAAMIREAVNQAQLQHGQMTHDHSRALNILGEEVDEACRAYLERTRPGATAQSWVNFAAELAQVAAVAQLMIQNLFEEHQP